MKSRWNDARNISQRLVIAGTLRLLTPARFGGGKASQTTDMPILRDLASRKPLLPGASVAGAMRAYLNEFEAGYEKTELTDGLAQALFGQVLEKESLESCLTIDDALATTGSTEFRPGVKIDPKTRIVSSDPNKKGQLYDMELLEAGTTFDLRFELELPDDVQERARLKQALAVALTGFEKGEIGMGARKRRGFGECKVDGWKVGSYNLKDPKALVAWIEGEPGQEQKGKDIVAILGVKLPADQRRRFCLEAEFTLETSLLIRSASTDPHAPDIAHLRSKRGGTDVPILSGTSLAGAIRARSLRIAYATIKDEAQAQKLVSEVFGPAELKSLKDRKKVEESPYASRAVIRERAVTGRNDLVQSRIRIDRFTGGTFPGALFEQQPVFGGEKSKVEVSIELRAPQDEHIALLLNVLKDLWTGDLPVGGEASAGRGRLKGKKATLIYYDPNGKVRKQEWIISASGGESLEITGNRQALDAFAKGGMQ
jgi:CRISPR/Cas system CSM-associated protein Csm3 (group 7 of RAMP superfamily)